MIDGVIAIILAGGRGKRMDILCQRRPKPALPFAGRFRVIDFSLSNCIHSQLNNIAVLTDYQRSSMANYLRRWYILNGNDQSLYILAPKSGSYHGTADAVYQNIEYLNRYNDDTVLILAGDHVYKMDYRQMLSFHERSHADVTIGVVSVPIEQARRFGIITADNDGRITDFVEKPRLPQSNLVSMGIYIFNKKVLCEYLTEDAAIKDSPHDFGYAIIPKIVKNKRAFAFKYDGYWQDIGTKETYYSANMELTRQWPSFTLDSTWPVLSQDNNLPSTRESRQGVIKDSLVSPGCVIKGYVENSVLSPGVVVEEEAVVTKSVLMENVTVGYHSIVDCCILDEGVNIDKYSYIGFGSSLISGDWNVTILGKEVNIPPYTAIGRNCKVLPFVKPADFTAKTISSDSVIAPRSSSSART